MLEGNSGHAQSVGGYSPFTSFQPFASGLFKRGRQGPPGNLIPGFLVLAAALLFSLACYRLALRPGRFMHDSPAESEAIPPRRFFSSMVEHVTLPPSQFCSFAACRPASRFRAKTRPCAWTALCHGTPDKSKLATHRESCISDPSS